MKTLPAQERGLRHFESQPKGKHPHPHLHEARHLLTAVVQPGRLHLDMPAFLHGDGKGHIVLAGHGNIQCKGGHVVGQTAKLHRVRIGEADHCRTGDERKAG